MVIEKIVVIAMGLVAVVPQGDNDGATILLRDAFLSTPRAELANGTECPVHFHLPLIVQTAGYCERDCTSFNMPAAGAKSVAARALGLAGTTSAGKAALRWAPVLESVGFDNLSGTPMEHDEDYWFYYGKSSHAEVDGDCMGSATSCPIVSRLEIEKGGVMACTLSEYRDATRSGPAGFVTKKFEDVADIGKEPPEGDALAESYAIVLPTNMQAPLRLSAKNFAGGRTLREAELYPDSEGTIVLVVTNLPLDIEPDHGDRGCEKVSASATAHSAVVYDLADGNPPAADRHVPHLAMKVKGTPTIDATCATHLATLDSVIPKVLDYPSNPSKCKPPGVLME